MALTMHEKLFKKHEKPNPYPGEVYLNNALRLLLKCNLDDPKIVNAISEIGFCFQKCGWPIQEDNHKKLAEEGLLFTVPKNPCNDCKESAFSTTCKCEDKAKFDGDRWKWWKFDRSNGLG